MTPRERKACDAMKLALASLEDSKPLASDFESSWNRNTFAKLALKEALAEYFGSERQEAAQ